MAVYRDCWWTSPDGLRLHARDYPGSAAPPPMLCLPGLTRNARDFEEMANRLAPARRVLALDFRGRGLSEAAKDAGSYQPATYVADVQALLAEQGIPRFVAIGTSLGGVVTMLLAAAGAPIAAAVINDIGPEIEAAGIARIRGQVGRASSYPTWIHAARALVDSHGDIHTGWGIEDWLTLAKRLYRLNAAGRIVHDYDPRIAEPLRAAEGEAMPDLWEAFAALARVPMLIVRGSRSDLLSAAVAERMAAALADGELLTVPGVGHAPTLDEPGVAAAIGRLLAKAR